MEYSTFSSVTASTTTKKEKREEKTKQQLLFDSLIGKQREVLEVVKAKQAKAPRRKAANLLA